MASDKSRRIEERAYALWVEGGRQHGTSEQDWRRAERDVAAEPEAADALGGGDASSKRARALGASKSPSKGEDSTAPQSVGSGEAAAKTSKKVRKKALSKSKSGANGATHGAKRSSGAAGTGKGA